MRVIDGYLSRQVQAFWPDAVVYRDSMLEPVEREDLNVDDRGQIIMYVLERLDEDPIGLGATFKGAKQAVAALKRQEEYRAREAKG